MTSSAKYLAARALLTAAGLAISVLATAQTAPAPTVPPLVAATVEPERIILNLTGDPQHEMAITWRSATGSAPGKVQFAVSEPGPNFVARATEVAAKTEALTLDVQEQAGFQATYNSVVLTGLKPATRYVYRVGDGTHWSEWFQFSTAGKAGDKFTFIYLGDAQNNVKEHWSRVLREALREDGKASFMLHAGDLINRHASDREWGEWFSAGGFIHAQTPSIMTPGNHEYGRPIDDTGARLSPQWRAQYTLPENGPEGRAKLKETAFYVDYQGVRVISIDAPLLHGDEAERAAQVQWLDKILANNPNTWTVISLHFPLYSSEPDRDNPRVREALKPLIDKYKVDLLLQGHDHGYARGAAPTARSKQNPKDDATVYVVSVAGPKMYAVSDLAWADRKASQTQLFQVLTVEGKSLNYKAFTANGELYDAFSLTKDAKGRKTRKDLKPATPELWVPGKKPPKNGDLSQ
ncbi:metallophosphoesterase family protein [Asticcacaulis sp. SL142]|uniref:purple acid phosphatase family protein n=1 Tax=Asticcacaulis sp. SL142 TaxID=2995155 RepID=UPI00226C6E3C|nr:metallophosphoesterase family protein [Asticcacaulis sp. SL142]WAC48007.1 metallophosphoesterase family protein [Asticcacaulis sp. SL142]